VDCPNIYLGYIANPIRYVDYLGLEHDSGESDNNSESGEGWAGSFDDAIRAGIAGIFNHGMSEDFRLGIAHALMLKAPAFEFGDEMKDQYLGGEASGREIEESARHIFWSAFIALNIGRDVAWDVVRSHEPYCRPNEDSQRDRANNGIGVSLGDAVRNDPEVDNKSAEVVRLIKQEFEGGDYFVAGQDRPTLGPPLVPKDE
jgi:hypothetical protein